MTDTLADAGHNVERIKHRIPGHTPLFRAEGDWRCRCGISLGASQSQSKRLMRQHRVELSALPVTPKPYEPRQPLAERFEKYVDRSGECHRWTGVHSPSGYGHFGYERRPWRAHIFALKLAGIDVPEGMTVDHVWARGCRHRDCVRIDHLEIVTYQQNVLRSNGPAAVNARKTHCKNGHEFTPENTYIINGRKRRCVICSKAAYREAKRKAAA